MNVLGVNGAGRESEPQRPRADLFACLLQAARQHAEPAHDKRSRDTETERGDVSAAAGLATPVLQALPGAVADEIQFAANGPLDAAPSGQHAVETARAARGAVIGASDQPGASDGSKPGAGRAQRAGVSPKAAEVASRRPGSPGIGTPPPATAVGPASAVRIATTEPRAVRAESAAAPVLSADTVPAEAGVQRRHQERARHGAADPAHEASMVPWHTPTAPAAQNAVAPSGETAASNQKDMARQAHAASAAAQPCATPDGTEVEYRFAQWAPTAALRLALDPQASAASGLMSASDARVQRVVDSRLRADGAMRARLRWASAPERDAGVMRIAGSDDDTGSVT